MFVTLVYMTCQLCAWADDVYEQEDVVPEVPCARGQNCGTADRVDPAPTPEVDPTAPTCHTPTREEVQEVLNEILHGPEYQWLVDSWKKPGCWRDGCFLRRVTLIKVIDEIFSKKQPKWCINWCYISVIYPEGVDWIWHTFPGWLCSNESVVYDPNGGTTIPLSDFIFFDTYGPDALECKPLSQAVPGADPDAPVMCTIMPSNPGAHRPPRGSQCQFYANIPNCPFYTEGIEDLKNRLTGWCGCAEAVEEGCKADCHQLLVNNPTREDRDRYNTCMTKCTREQNSICKRHIVVDPPPLPPLAVDCNDWGTPEHGQSCSDYCSARAKAAFNRCTTRGSSAAVCERVYYSALSSCNQSCVQCKERSNY